MERIEVLISKLKDQYDQKAGASKMLMTVRLIENELAAHSSGQRQGLGTSKVSVVLPRSMATDLPLENDEFIPQEETPLKEKEVIIENINEPVEHNKYMPSNRRSNKEQMNLGFDPFLEIPTLSQQTVVKEINDSVSSPQPSLNDRLKQPKTELAETLKEAPIRDLRKAIGINDRFVFISELFRGDEAMYERSIKTINSFNIYAEAEYWINRELKTKIGWDDSKKTVQHFYHLVKRRFS
ncbi:MAG TPA: hypothetical protein VIQ00_02175 [Chitinophagaceae bacterium]